MIDTILIEIVLYRSDLFAPSIEMFFPQIWFQQDLAANRSPALFASVMKYSPLFSTYIYIRIYMYPYSFEIYSFRSMNWIRGNFRVRSISAKEMKEFRLFRSRLQITFYCLGKNIKVNEKLWELLDALWETTPFLIILNGNNRFVFSCESQIRYHFPVVWFQIYNRLRKKIFSKINSSISKRLFPFFTTHLSVKFDNSSAIVSNKLETIILNAWVHMIPINE